MAGLRKWTRAIIKFTLENDYFIKSVFLVDNRYDVRPDGTIWTRLSTNGCGLLPRGKWRRAGFIKEGYVIISYPVERNGKRVKKTLRAHRIVYQKYNGELRADMVVNHKNGVKSDNTPSNLELISYEDNNSHAFNSLNQSPIKNFRLSFEIATQIRDMRLQGATYKEICNKFDISKGHVSEIVNNRIWVTNEKVSIE